METASISVLARRLLPLAAKLLPRAKRLWAERVAGVAPGSVRTDLLDGIFDETLDRLVHIDTHEAWWRDLLRRAEGGVVRPGFLEVISVREWLSNRTVREDLKALARAELLPGPDAATTAARERLAAAYAERTLEAPELAVGPIEVAVAMLLAGTLSQAGQNERLLAGLIQESHGGLMSAIADVREAIQPRPGDDIVAKALTDECLRALRSVVRRRTMPGIDAMSEIAALAQRVQKDGDLRYASDAVRADVFRWAARLHAAAKVKAPEARRYREMLLTFDRGADTSIIDAWLDAHSGNPQDGLRRLRAKDAPDARANLFTLLKTFEGSERALEWLDSYREAGPGLLTGTGWRNAAVALAEAGRWADAARHLALAVRPACG